MAIYGREPATDRMLLVICHLCGRVLKLQAVLKHNGEGKLCTYVHADSGGWW